MSRPLKRSYIFHERMSRTALRFEIKPPFQSAFAHASASHRTITRHDALPRILIRQIPDHVIAFSVKKRHRRAEEPQANPMKGARLFIMLHIRLIADGLPGSALRFENLGKGRAEVRDWLGVGGAPPVDVRPPPRRSTCKESRIGSALATVSCLCHFTTSLSLFG